MLWSGQTAAICHIGDSRAYLLRDGQFYQITHDHTLVQSLVDEGRITEDDVATHPQRSLLLRALDGRTLADPDLSTHETTVGDRYLLCSDGLSGVVTEQTLHQALSSVRDPDKAALQLVELALKGGGPDNITCIVADVVDTQATAVAPTLVPVMAGAASAGPPEQLRSAARQHSPAGRAGRLRRTSPQFAVPDEAGSGDWPGNEDGQGTNGYHVPDPDNPPGRRRGHRARKHDDDDDEYRVRPGRRRWPIVTTLLIVLVLLIGGGLFASWQYVQSQYYLGEDHGNLAIFRGVNSSVAGLSLSSPYDRTSLPVSELPATAQVALGQTISTNGLGDAQDMVKAVENTVSQCRTEWQQLAAWNKANETYQTQLTAYNKLKTADAHARPPKTPPAPPASPGTQPPTPQEANCGTASAFGIPASALPAGTTSAGTAVTPTTSPTTAPASVTPSTARPSTSAPSRPASSTSSKTPTP